MRNAIRYGDISECECTIIKGFQTNDFFVAKSVCKSKLLTNRLIPEE
jgi:hypothetical protein